MPNFRFKLPSRNWSIFFTIVGSWTAAYAYDRREKKRILQKWQDRVSHLALQPLRPEEMPRSVRIILGAPPADGLLTAREHFHEYVKPILTAGGMDWEAVEGRKEGDVRAMIAEKIREVRIRAGETGEIPERDEGEEKKDMVREIRERSGVDVEGGKATPAGDIVIGRNIWKEYMRGLHEGWLGPLSPPIVPVEEVAAETNPDTPTEATAQRDDPQQLDTPHSEPEQSIVETLTDIVEPANTSESTPFVEDSTGTSQSDSDKVSEEKKKSEEEEEAKKKAEKAKRKQPPPFMSTVEYADAALPPTIPRALGPAIAVPLPHILGFLNTPIRMYRFLKQRELAEDIGRQVVSAVLGAHEPYQQITVQQDQGQGDDLKWEQEESLKNEESEWHKSTRKKAWENKEAGKESLWVDDMVVDSRIVGRMRKFVLPDSTQEQGTSEEMS
jgi:import inner membrane translocase subunit TIM54